jgi:hypothetical protein
MLPHCDFIAACKGSVRVVDDGRDPYACETHAIANIVGMVQHAFEVTAQIADVVRAAVGSFEWDIEAAMLTPLIALVIARDRH